MDFFKHPNSSIWKGFDEALEAIDDVHSVEQLADLEIKRTGSKIRSGYYRCTVWNGEYTPKELRLATSRDADQQYLAWTTVHEMGHVLDHQMFGRGTKFMSEQVELHADSLRATESYAHLDVSNDPNEAYAFMDWWDAVQSSDSYKALKNFDRGIYSFNPETGQWRKGIHENATHYAELGSSAIRSYLDPKELFARAYVQYIATRSGNATLNAQLEKELQDQDAGFAPLQWRPEEFKPIAEAMDEILRVKGCLKE